MSPQSFGVVPDAEITLPIQENNTLHVATVTQEVTRDVVAVPQPLVSSNGDGC